MGCSLCAIQRSDEHYKLLQGKCQVKKKKITTLCCSWLVTVSFWFVYSSLTYSGCLIKFKWIKKCQSFFIASIIIWLNEQISNAFEVTPNVCMLKRLRKVILPKEGMCFGDCVLLTGSWEGHTLLKKSEKCLRSRQNT